MTDHTHTPLPWIIEPHPADRTLLIYGPQPTCRLIAELSQQTRFGGVECAANADYIVECCNNYPALLAANKTMRKASKRFQEAAWAFEDSTELEPESEESNRIYSEFCDASDALTAALTATPPQEKP